MNGETIVLKPCPFCGLPPDGPEFVCEAGRWDVWQVECRGCGVTIESPYGLAGDDAEKGAIAAWNTRHKEG